MTKKKNALFLRLGLLGNHTQVWNTWEEWKKTGGGCVGMRSWTPSGLFKAQIASPLICPKLFETHYLQGTAPDEYRTINGEVQQVPGGLNCYYSTYPAPMREALAKGGRQAENGYWLVKHYMDDASWENLWNLFDVWPDHVVEFTCFSRGVGVLGWNTLFWEVRDY